VSAAKGRHPKPHRWWGITYVNSADVMPDTIRATRREAQEACCRNRYQFRENSDDWEAVWRDWHKRGCKAVRVIVTVEPQA
jgi:hypothetical protein